MKNDNIVKMKKMIFEKDKLYLFFNDGYLIKTTPKVDRWFDADFFIIKNQTYDLSQIIDVNNIPIDFTYKRAFNYLYGYAGLIFYILRHKAISLRAQKQFDLSYACLRKSNQMAMRSDFGLTQKDAMQIVYWLWEDGRFDEADLERNNILENDSICHYTSTLSRKINKSAIENALASDFEDSSNSGLLYLHWNPCIKDCSSFSQRIYSVDGKDSRFPRLPEQFFSSYELHSNCQCFLSNYTYWDDAELDYIQYHGKECHNIIEISNRPFVDDDRTPQMIECCNDIEQKKLKLIRHDVNMELYYRLKYTCPEIAPKTLSAFSRMRNSNSKKFQEMQAYALKHGLEI